MRRTVVFSAGIVFALVTARTQRHGSIPGLSRWTPFDACSRCIVCAPGPMDFLQPRVGDQVWVRRRRWTVRAADSYPDCRVLTLERTSHTDRARHMQIIQPFDDVRPTWKDGSFRRVGSRQWQSACRALLSEEAHADSLHSAASAAIDILPFQLEPTLALLKGLGTRLLIADEVGLGKTVQALLAVAELRARGVVARILIVCPAGLRDQWAQECVQRFALPFFVADQSSLRRVAAELPHGVNAWQTQPLSIVSSDYVKRPEVLSSALAVSWDMVIVDEAHGVCGLSERQEAVSQLTARAQYVVLLTATPHNGDAAGFNALCTIGSHGDRLLVFRRRKHEAGDNAGRRIHVNRVTPTEAERRMQVMLVELTDTIRRERVTSESHAWLVLTVLHKRALSGGQALAASVARRLALLGSGGTYESGQAQLLLPLSGDEDDTSDAAPMWSDPALRDVALERSVLARLLVAARDASRADSKVRFLRRLLARLREPAIVFTEYRDTLLHLVEVLGREAAVIHGGLSRSERQSATSRFPQVGLLLATDAAGEGLNLHHACRTVINLELPWNPMRLEQRIGRVDRIGQRRRVHVFHLIAASTGEAALLRRLTARIRRAHASIATANPLGNAAIWTEADSARLVMFAGEKGDDVSATAPEEPAPIAPASAEPPPVELPSTDTRGGVEPQICGLRLLAEAERDVHRVALIRRLQGWSGQADADARATATATATADANAADPDDDGRHASHTSWTAARNAVVLPSRPLLRRLPIRTRLRRILAGRTLSIVRVTVVDANGARLATRIVGFLSPTTPARSTSAPGLAVTHRARGSDGLHGTAASRDSHDRPGFPDRPGRPDLPDRPGADVGLEQLLDEVTRQWFDEVTTTHRKVAAVRATRAAAILRYLDEHPRIWQPGLFNRRTEHDRERAGVERLRAVEEARSRLSQEQRATSSVALSYDVMLVAGPELQRGT